jgi:hypothetical protein
MLRAGFKGRSAGGFVLAVALSVATVFAVPANAQDTDGLIPEGDWSQDQIDYMLDLIDETERVLPETFPASGPRAEVEAELEAMGFFNFGVPAPGGYWHMINPGWIVDDEMLNPEFAESLVYKDVGGGNWELQATMYMAGADDTVDDLPEDIAWIPGWHGHPELCTWDEGDAFGRFAGVTDPDDPDCPEGSSNSPTPVMIHTWIVDGVCDHRFGGVGVSGVHCDVHGDGHGNHRPGDDDDHDDDHDDDGHDDDHDDDDGHDDDDHDHDDSTPAATPVSGTPSFTG